MPGGGKKAVFPTLALHDHEQVRVAANEQEKAKRFHHSRERTPKTRRKTLRDLFTKSKADDLEKLINVGQHENRVEVKNEVDIKGKNETDSATSIDEGNDKETISTTTIPEDTSCPTVIEEGGEILEGTSASNESTDDELEIENPEDPLTKFFLSMAATTLTLPQHLQIEVKQKVFDAVIAAENAALQESGQMDSIESSISERMATHSITAINPANFCDVGKYLGACEDMFKDLRLGGIPWYPSSHWVPSPERRACNLRLRQLQEQQEENARGTAGLGVDANLKRKSSEGGKDSPEKETPKVKNKNPQKTEHSSK